MIQQNFLEVFKEAALKAGLNKPLPQDLPMITNIASLGIDSVSMMEIIGLIEDVYRIRISDEKLAKLQTIEDLERVTREALASPTPAP